MKFECKTEGCSKEGELLSLAVTNKKWRDGAFRTIGTKCEGCEQWMEDITEFNGFGLPLTPTQHRGKSFFNRGSQKVHSGGYGLISDSNKEKDKDKPNESV